jgi:cell division protein FtsN
VNVAAIYNIASKMKISNPDSILNSGMNSGPASVRADEGRAPGTVKTVETQQEQAPQTIMQEPLKKDGKVYTVQIKADRKRGDLIKGMENLKVVKGDDGYFRYFVGEYSSIEDAKRAQKRLADEGYRDCFVKVLK